MRSVTELHLPALMEEHIDFDGISSVASGRCLLMTRLEDVTWILRVSTLVKSVGKLFFFLVNLERNVKVFQHFKS